MEFNDTIAGLSAIGSLLAALWARSSAVSARRALDLAQAESTSRQEDLSVYLIDAMKWIDKDSLPCIAASCSVTNSSSSPTTIKQIELLVHAINRDGVQIPTYVPLGTAKPEDSNLTLLSDPLNLDARSSASGWLSFKLPVALKGQRVERYEIVFHTWSGQRANLNIYQVKSVS